jgi:signal transduction histidine kinase
MKRLLGLIAVLLLALTGYAAEPLDDEELETVEKQFQLLYGEQGRDDEFYALSKKLKDHYQGTDSLKDYCRVELTEVLYEVDRNRMERALTLLKQMRNDLEAEGILTPPTTPPLQGRGVKTENSGNEWREAKSETAGDEEWLTPGKVWMLLLLVLIIIAMALLAFFVVIRRLFLNRMNERNEQLKSTLKMAEEANEMKAEFIRNISHEIRTPLNAIKGFNEVLNNPTMELDYDEKRDLVERIDENVKIITDIIDKMLQAAEESTQGDYARTDTVACNQFLSDLLNSYREQVNVNVKLIYTTQVLNRFTLQTNGKTLQRIMENLIENAIKYTERGVIKVTCQKIGYEAVISVSDTGVGIAPEMQDQVFEYFAKVDTFRRGIGLGLPLSRQMARKLGGDLTIDKDYQHGSCFVLTLPVE